MSKRDKPALFSITAFLRCIGYAARGIATAVKTQRNAQLHIIAALIVIAAGIYLGINRQDWLWITLAVCLVWMAELINSAFEYLCDLVQPDYHEAVKHAKDIAAGAVLIAVVTAIIIGLIVFAPYAKAALMPALQN